MCGAIPGELSSNHCASVGFSICLPWLASVWTVRKYNTFICIYSRNAESAIQLMVCTYAWYLYQFVCVANESPLPIHTGVCILSV